MINRIKEFNSYTEGENEDRKGLNKPQLLLQEKM
jgi:hypothetical protein